MRRAALDGLPRLGWASAPTPVDALPSLAEELGLGWLGAKRDDAIEDLHGGSKVRKLDFLLASPPIERAERWTSCGAIGSGHLATLTAAAERLGRRLRALTFFEPYGPWVEENLAFTASGPTELRYVESRLGLAVRHPRAVLGRGEGVIPPGASDAVGTLGMVRAGLELAEQIEAGELPPLDRIYVPLGSGGTAAGLALGLALGGQRVRVHAVAAVERLFARLGRVAALTRAASALLRARGVAIPAGLATAPVVIERGALGPGYGHATAASVAATERLARLEVPLEPVYGGKAMAALAADAPAMTGERVLLWVSGHRGPLQCAEDWRERLPPELQRIVRSSGHARTGRRRLVVGGVAAAAGVALAARVGFHDDVEGWEGHVLHAWEGAVLAAAAAAIVPEVPGGPIDGGVTPDAIALHVDRYLVGLSTRAETEVHGLFALVEHGTALAGYARRFTRLSPVERRDVVASLAARGGELAAAAKGLRDLCYLGAYQDARAFAALSYGGPWVAGARTGPGAYDALRAAPGALPPGRVRA
ncbi:MAG: pyridoxal-phosphate dependent enzyme [Sandaracinaceae bacterium]|nr:pyridoxal-phosphate dependent enzyme [Sandaracinaceae bacterium]